MPDDGVLRPTRDEPALAWLPDGTIADADWRGVAGDGSGAQVAAEQVRHPGGATTPAAITVSTPAQIAVRELPAGAATISAVVDAGSSAPILAAVPAAAAFAATAVVEVSAGSLQVTPGPMPTEAIASGVAITNGVGDVSAQQIAALLTNLQSTLDLIESGLENTGFAESLPLIGNQLAAAFTEGQSALSAFKTLDDRIISALTTLENAGTAEPLSVVQSALNAAITAAGFSGSVSTSLDAGGNLSVTLASSDALASFSVPLGTNFGIPGLNFATQGHAQAALTYGVNLTADVAQGGSFSISAPTGALKLGLDVTAPNFTGDAEFGPLRVIAADNSSSLTGTITLGTNGVATLTGNANVDVNLTSDLGTAALPSITTELTANWGFNPNDAKQNDTLDPSNETHLGSTPTIALNNVKVGIGTFVTNLVKPVLDDLEQVIKPIQPILDLLNAPIAPIMALPEVVWQQLNFDKDTIGGQDKVVNLLDFIDKDEGGSDSALDKVIGLFNEVNTLESYFQNASAGSIQFSLGNLDIPTNQDIRANGFNISSVVPIDTGEESLSALLNAANAFDSSGVLGANLNTLLTPGTSDQGGFSFPILDNPASAASLLFGGKASLVKFQLPEANFGWGTLDSSGTITNASTLFAVPLFTGVQMIVVGALVGQFGLDFGLDTTGLTAFAKGGYNDPTLILNGLYAANPTLDGMQVPMATFGGEIGLGVSAGITGTDVSGTGDVSGVVNIGLANGGTEYLGNVINLLNTNPLGLFNVDGRITAGLDFNVDVLGQKVFGISSPRVVLYPPAGQGSSANNLPTTTKWGAFAGADFETANNWSPTFAAVSDGTVSGTWDLFADCTIDLIAEIGPVRPTQPESDYFVTFNGPLEADLYSLQLALGSNLIVQSGTLLIDGSSQVSNIAGSLAVNTAPGALLTTELILSGVVNNTGGIGIDAADIGVAGVLDLTGGGSITGASANALWTEGFAPSVHVGNLLRNDDNVIDGIGVIDVQFENHGQVIADQPGRLVLDHNLHNSGVLEAAPQPGKLIQITQGTLEIQADLSTASGSLDVDNTGGTISAGGGGNVFIGAGNISGNGIVVEIHGGTLAAPHIAEVTDGTITLRNVVILDGGTVGMTVHTLLTLGTFSAGASLLTLTGLIQGPTYGSAPGKNGFASNGSNIELFDATIRGGVLDGRVPTGSLTGIIQVETSATLDGSAGVAGVGIDGTLHIGSAQTLALGGGIVPAAHGGAIDMGGGTIVVGILGDDAASLGPAAIQGTLLMDGTTSNIVARDTASVLSNSWQITGIGGIAGGLVNTAAGTISAVNGFMGIASLTQASTNQGLIIATSLGVITIDSELNNAGGTLRADGGTILLRTYATAGGVLETPNGGTIDLLSGELLSGVGVALTLAAGSHIVLGADQAITGSIVNLTTLALDGNTKTALVKTLHVTGTATLSGGGSVLMSDDGNGGGVSTQVITGTQVGDVLDNVDNTISGSGVIGFGVLGLINEAAGTILANGGTLTIGADFTNNGVVAAMAGSTLELDGAVIDGGDSLPGALLNAATLNVIDTGNTLLADGGTIVFSGSIAGGTLDERNGGKILSNSGTLDGRADAVTIPGTVTVSAPATLPPNGKNTLVLEGTIANAGTIAMQADSSKAENQRTVLVAGTASLIAGGLLSMTDLSPPGAAVALLGSSAADILDNADNRIVGVGKVGENQLSLTNEAAGVIEASGGLLVFQASGTAVNRGTLAALGGTLDALGIIDNAGGTIAALTDGPGLVLLDGLTVQGGTLASDAASMLTTTGSGATLDGTANAVTVAASANAQVISGSTLTLRGTLVDQGSITATGTVATAVDVLVSGTVTITGTGTIALVDATGLGKSATQVFAGHTISDVLDNGAVIRGVGLLGNDAMTLVNDTGGTVSADSGTLAVRTGNIAITNRGLLTAAPTGILSLFNNVNNVGGTIAATGSGISRLEQITVTGGNFAGAGGGQVIADVATIDGRASTVTLTAGAHVGVLPEFSNSLVLEGNFANSGTLFVAALASEFKSNIIISDAVRLTGGGRLQLIDDAATPGFGESFVVGNDGTVVDAYASNTLDNVDNTISGTGRLGNAELAITNEAAGLISAVGGALSLITASNNSIPTQGRVVNAGTMQAFGTVLYIDAVVDNRGGVVQALSDGAGHSGTVDLNGASFQGGTFQSEAADPASFILADAYGGTLDGSLQAVTLGTGEPLRVLPRGSLALTGSIVNHGTLVVQANSTAGEFATVQIAGTVVLSGGGQIAMSNLSDGNSDRIHGSSGADVLDNLDNTIIGNGDIGFEATSLTNEAAGIIAAQGGTLRFDPSGPGTTVANRGLLEALGGTLDLLATIDNAGGIIATRNDGAGHSGVVVLFNADIQGGVVAGDSTDASSQILVGAASTLDGSAGALTLDASSHLEIDGGETLHLKGSIVEHGSAVLPSDTFFRDAVLQIDGSVVLSGGGTIDLALPDGTGEQIIDGAGSGDSLENAGVTIVGAGHLGVIHLSFTNDPAGIVRATGGTLVIPGGLVNFTNYGLLAASAGAVLDLSGNVANTGGTIDGGGGRVLLDNGGTVVGGNFSGQVFSYGDTVEGGVVIAPGATVGVSASYPDNAAGKSLTLAGGVVNHGTLLVQGSDTASNIAGLLLIAGTVSLSGGGVLMLTGTGTHDLGTQSQVKAAAAGAVLDDIDNLVFGYGTIGVGAMPVIVEAAANIRAQGGTLDVVGPLTGTGTLAIADSSTLKLDGSVATSLTVDFLLDGSHETLDLAAPPPAAPRIAHFAAADGVLPDLAAALLDGTTIEHFATTDTISFPGVFSTITPSVVGNTVTLSSGGATIATFVLAGNDAADHVSVTNVGGTVTLTTSVACYAAGTRILTEAGEILVEALRAGDRVATHSGGLRPIRWIGMRHLDCAGHPAPAEVMPVRIRAHAFGPGMPHRDLLLSPDHAVFSDGSLIPVRYLVNGCSIVQEHAGAVTYYHVELASHDVIVAEGLPCETYLDTGNRGAFAYGDAIFDADPDFAPRISESDASAGLVAQGVQVAAVN